MYTQHRPTCYTGIRTSITHTCRALDTRSMQFWWQRLMPHSYQTVNLLFFSSLTILGNTRLLCITRFHVVDVLPILYQQVGQHWPGGSVHKPHHVTRADMIMTLRHRACTVILRWEVSAGFWKLYSQSWTRLAHGDHVEAACCVCIRLEESSMPRKVQTKCLLHV